jgi:hypothetical protein
MQPTSGMSVHKLVYVVGTTVNIVKSEIISCSLKLVTNVVKLRLKLIFMPPFIFHVSSVVHCMLFFVLVLFPLVSSYVSIH